jgi:hypothetical protein
MEFRYDEVMPRVDDDIIGFTGTKMGMTNRQKNVFSSIVANALELHHGDDSGADLDAHNIARKYGVDFIFFNNPYKYYIRAFCQGDYTMPEAPFLKRNKNIVDYTDLLVACPNGFEEVIRSGTWATWRYAVKQEKLWIIIWPDGTNHCSWEN